MHTNNPSFSPSLPRFSRLNNRTLVDNGASLNQTNLLDLRHNSTLMEEHSVRCILSIENWTQWRLKDALAHNHCGYIHDDFKAPNVDPAVREIMIGHKQVQQTGSTSS